MLRFWQIYSARIVWSANAVLFLLGVLALYPIYADVCAKDAHTAAQDCARYHILAYVIMRVGESSHDYHGILTAIATAFIAWFTWTLRRSTDKLWDAGEKQRELSEKTAERQLRAYVFVEGDSKDNLPVVDAVNGIIKFPLKAINRGQTPAYKVTRWSNVEVLPYPLTVDLEGIPAGAVWFALDLGPNTPVGMEASRRQPWSQDQIDGVLAGTMRIYVYGEVRYLDIFKNEQNTKFRFMARVLRDGSIPGLEACEEGNDAS